MKSFLLTLSAMVVLIAKSALATQDPSIDRLLSKLPPPEKFVDPAINDPLAKQMIAAAKAQNFGSALDAARKLAGRYPKSLGAQMVHGMLAIALRRFPEASAAYHKALALHPDLAAAYVGLGASEFFQQHFGAALTDFRHVTQLAPKAEVGWTGASVCAERLGRRKESLEYARRATVVAPSSAAAWYQLAREEGLFGDKQAAATALARANKLQRNAPEVRSSRPKTPRS
jgi:tetratricopeptide (TPR) repeat protein